MYLFPCSCGLYNLCVSTQILSGLLYLGVVVEAIGTVPLVLDQEQCHVSHDRLGSG